jgi:hypothetical protein
VNGPWEGEWERTAVAYFMNGTMRETKREKIASLFLS